MADTSPPVTTPATPATVTNDQLPTMQIDSNSAIKGDGVVWAQVTVGNTVYVTGSFSQVRPYGAAQNLSTDTVRSNLLAYDITTGNLITSFNHTLNAQGLAITASPDGSKIFVGGDFTQVDGASHPYIVAFDTSTGAIDSGFSNTAKTGNSVRALAATNSTVYAGGAFFTADGHGVNRLAALSTTTGGLLSWSTTANAGSGQVNALLVSPDGTKVVVAGNFTSLNGATSGGIGALDATTGALDPWSSSFPLHDTDTNAAFDTLTTDGTSLYGAGYNFHGNGGTGNFEGRFSSDFAGNLNWLDSCHGDSYSVFIQGQVLYTAGHPHDCSDVGTFDDTAVRSYHRAVAETLTSSGNPVQVNTDNQYSDFSNQSINNPALTTNTQLHWYPTLSAGTVTGQTQAAWSVTGNATYLSFGGEFPKINGYAQQGLVRFAIPSAAPKKWPPYYSAATNTPTVVSLSNGTARVHWQATWDADNASLTYQVYRDPAGTAPANYSKTAIYSTTVSSEFWQLPSLGFTDTGLTPGASYIYRVTASDPNGNRQPAQVASAPVTISSTTVPAPSTYANDVTSDGATEFWKLSEAAGNTAYDYATSYDDLTLDPNATRGTAGPIAGDSSTATTFPGTSTNGPSMGSTPHYAPNTFSIESWIKTSSTSGGKIISYGNAPGYIANNDRQLYMDNAGHLLFGVDAGKIISAAAGAQPPTVYADVNKAITSTKSYNDNTWHYVVGTFSASTGMTLYVDGQRVARNQAVTTAKSYIGNWRVGGDTITGWPSGASSTAPSSGYFKGSIADAAVYPTVLGLSNVQKHYTDSGATLSTPPTPTDAYGQAVSADSPDLYWRLNETSGTTAADASPNQTPGVYTTSGVTLGTGPAFTSSTKSATFTVGGLASSSTFSNPVTYSEETWFKSKSSTGGNIIGFGSSQTGSSTSHDRQVYLNTAGQLVFAVNTTTPTLITSPSSYNNGAWHQVVATQGSDGMTLYVDGKSVATSPVNTAASYTGYLRVASDKTDTGSSATNFAGSVDEVSLYPTELSAARVLAHYNAASSGSSNTPPTATIATPSCTYQNCSFDGSGSSDSDGSIASYSWDFGDNSTGTGAKPTHTYAASGTYTVMLVVTDDSGATSTATTQLTVVAAPVATFTAACSALACSFNGSSSTPGGGTISSYAWNFGDGSTGTGATTNHTYATGGTYTVTLTVTDTSGGTNTASKSISPAVAGNAAPTAVFTSTCTQLSCTFDGTGSTDSDGTVASYAWDFGDGATATTSKPTHAYTAAGTYTVKLTVTDNQGATNSVSHSVTASTTAAAPFAKDAFNRTVSNGFGTADTGGAWTATSGATSVTPGSGVFTLAKAGAAATAYLNSVSVNDADITTTVAINKAATGGGDYFYVIGRKPGTNIEYRAVIHVVSSGAVSVGFTKLDNSATETTVSALTTVSGLTYTAGTALHVHVQVTGTNPTTLRARVWTGSTEPTTWQSSTTDSTASLQTKGAIGLRSYLSSSVTNAPVTFSVSALNAQPTAPAGNVAPVAAFTSSCSQLSCSFNGTGSSDSDGSISSYAWTFGDGATSTAASPTHAYAAAGSYSVTLTVTDNQGATGSVSHTVSPSTAAVAAFAADAFNRTVSNGFGTADTGGAWTATSGATSVTPGSGVFTLAKASAAATAYLNSVSVNSADITVTLTINKTLSGGGYFYVIGRKPGTNIEYRGVIHILSSGAVSVGFTKLANSTTETTVSALTTVSGLTYTAGTALHVHVQVTGTSPTTLRARVWTGSTEPTTWQNSTTDSTAVLQTSGAVGLRAYLSSGTTNAPITFSVSAFNAQAVA